MTSLGLALVAGGAFLFGNAGSLHAVASAGGGLPAAGLAAVTSPVAAGPAISLSPATDLADGQYVKVNLSNYPAGVGVAFRQCIAVPKVVATDCTAVNTRVIAITDANGAASTYLPVYSGSDPALKQSGGTGQITCDLDHGCAVAALRSTRDLTGAVLAPLSFIPTPDNCPAQGASGLLGTGAASAYRAMYRWESLVCTAPRNLQVTYSLLNSVDGYSNFLSNLADFGVAGPLPGPTPTAPGVSYRRAPLTASSLVLAYRIYDQAGPQIADLTLTPKLVAQIFRGQIPNFAINPEITALNPGVAHFPPRMTVVARAEHSAQSFIFTSWLAAAAPETWTLGASDIFPLPAAGVKGVTTSDKVGLSVIDPTTPWFDVGNIGFMDASTAAYYGLPTVRIKRADGSIVAATPDTVRAAIEAAPVNADGTVTPNYGTTDPHSYPMPMVTYMIAPTSTIDPQKGQVLAQFLRYAVQEGQAVLPAGYVPLPQSLRSESLQVAAAIPVPQPPATPSPIPSPSALPTPAATPSPAPIPSLVPPPVPAVAVPPLAPGPVGPPADLGVGSLTRSLLPAGPTQQPSSTGSGTAPPGASCGSAGTATPCPGRAGVVSAAGTVSALGRIRDGQGGELVALMAGLRPTPAGLILPSIALVSVLALVAGIGIHLWAGRTGLGGL